MLPPSSPASCHVAMSAGGASSSAVAGVAFSHAGSGGGGGGGGGGSGPSNDSSGEDERRRVFGVSPGAGSGGGGGGGGGGSGGSDSGGAAGSRATPEVAWPQFRYKVEFYTRKAHEKQWTYHDKAYYLEFDHILTTGPVADWRTLGGLWHHTQLRIEEQELDESRFRKHGDIWYWPVDHR